MNSKCKSCVNEYYHLHKEPIDNRSRQYKEDNKEILAIKGKEYRKNNKDKISKSSKEYKQSHKEESRIYSNNRRALKRKLPHTLTIAQWRLMKQHFGNSCSYCGEERQLTQDHFVPSSKGGEYTINNIIPACGNCNSSKNNSDFFKWYPKQPFYSEEREKRILAYLGYKNNVQQLALV